MGKVYLFLVQNEESKDVQNFFIQNEIEYFEVDASEAVSQKKNFKKEILFTICNQHLFHQRISSNISKQKLFWSLKKF
jgi:ERCC4-related helicase